MRNLIIAYLSSFAAGSESRRVNGIVKNDQSEQIRYMTKEKQKSFLTKLFKKVDSDQNGKIDRNECVSWIQKIEHQHIGLSTTERELWDSDQSDIG